VKPAPFEWYRATSTGEALGLLAEHGHDAKPLAGGQSLIPAMSFRLARPSVLVDLNGVAELSGIAVQPDGVLRCGAMTRQRALERSPDVAANAPLIAEALPWVAHAAIRTRGTVGGSIAHGDPAAELPAVFAALDARYLVQSSGGQRWLAADAFMTGLFLTALEPGELLVAIEVPPMAPRTGWAFLEMARRHGDFALAGVACTLTLDSAGMCEGARIVGFGVGDGPVLCAKAATVLIGAAPGPKVILEAAATLAADVDPPSDIHATAAYRRSLVEVLTRRALTRAAERATVATTRNVT
jgi:CO/xanthine dehydrogenase FAD-binding subunit